MIEILNFLYNLVRGLASHLLSDPETRRNITEKRGAETGPGFRDKWRRRAKMGQRRDPGTLGMGNYSGNLQSTYQFLQSNVGCLFFCCFLFFFLEGGGCYLRNILIL